jgi:hypothetical protein
MSNSIQGDADTFMMWLGSCITEWAKVEEQMFKFCADILGMSTEHTAIIYYRTFTLEGRLSLIDELIDTVIPKPENGKHRHIDGRTWEGLLKNIKENMPVRNQLAHCPVGPVMRETKQSDSRKITLEFESYPHHHEVARGRTTKKNLVIGDLKNHFMAVSALHDRLRMFRCDKLPAHISEFYPQNISPLTGQD